MATSAKRDHANHRRCRSLLGQADWRIISDVTPARGGVRSWSELMKPAAFKATPKLGVEASRALLKAVGGVTLTEERRRELASLAESARLAFARPLPAKANGH